MDGPNSADPTFIEVIEACGEWFVRVVENGKEDIRSFDVESYALSFAEGQRMRLHLDKFTRLRAEHGTGSTESEAPQNHVVDSLQRPGPACHNMATPLILVLEDEALIGVDLEVTLAGAGFSVALARSCKDAAAFLADNRPDAAVLDILLADGECTEAARTLVEQGVPFIVHSGLLRMDSDPVFQRGTLINKPAGTPEIVDVLKRMVEGA